MGGAWADLLAFASLSGAGGGGGGGAGAGEEVYVPPVAAETPTYSFGWSWLPWSSASGQAPAPVRLADWVGTVLDGARKAASQLRGVVVLVLVLAVVARLLARGRVQS